MSDRLVTGSAGQKCPSSCMPADQIRFLSSALQQRGNIEIGKLNLFLIVLIFIIVAILLSNKDGGAELSSGDMRVQTHTLPQPLMEPETDSPANTHTVATAATEPEKPAPAPADKKPKGKQPSGLAKKAGSAPEQVAETAYTAPETEPPSASSQPKNIIVFNLWSVSELRLRKTYARWMNDSSIAKTQIEQIKKDYLSFVNKRAHQCGELDNKFPSNINSVEKLTFTDREVDILECHSSQNIAEMERLNTLERHPS